ncbi:MAG: hypothetical protein AB7T14_04150 [Candidatus Methylacidiphilaceae bacterium]
MRTLIDLTEKQIGELDACSKQEKTSRAALIRQAIDVYLTAHQRRSRMHSAFGITAKWTARLSGEGEKRMVKALIDKLPDAVVWASAQDRALLFVTRDRKDFPAGDPGVRFPYAH